jgi:hypothetical protein
MISESDMNSSNNLFISKEKSIKEQKPSIKSRIRKYSLVGLDLIPKNNLSSKLKGLELLTNKIESKKIDLNF